jgi:hypothetical protein
VDVVQATGVGVVQWALYRLQKCLILLKFQECLLNGAGYRAVGT